MKLCSLKFYCQLKILRALLLGQGALNELPWHYVTLQCRYVRHTNALYYQCYNVVSSIAV